jgi:hypothetical protein
MSSFLYERIGIVSTLAQKAPGGWIGRTALMKFCYFLQTLRGVPLGYNFSLYSYGPFDSAVLSDLGDAEALGILKEDLAVYPTGYGYRISPTVPDEKINNLGGALLSKYRADVDWVINEFGNLSAAQLELLSTIVYADREASRSGETVLVAELARRVREVKPHFTADHILRDTESLRTKDLLLATQRN